jgi:hypothetical protein
MNNRKSRSSAWVTGAILSGVSTAAVAVYAALTVPEISEHIAGLIAFLTGTFLVLWLFATGIIAIWKDTERAWQWLIVLFGISISVAAVYFLGPRIKGIKLAISPPSPTSMPTPTSLSTPLPSPVPGVLYSDDFSNNQSGWQQSNNAGEEFQYSDGQYVIGFPGDGLAHLACAHRNFSDAVLTVDSVFLSGDADHTWSWVIWRFIDIHNFYILEFNAEGDFCVSKRSDGNYQALAINHLDSTSGILKKGKQWNSIAIFSKNGASSISFNGNYVANVADSQFPSGDICLGATSIGTGTGTVAFDNLVVYAIDAWAPFNK